MEKNRQNITNQAEQNPENETSPDQQNTEVSNEKNDFTQGNTFATAYFEITLMVFEVLMIYFIRKLKYLRQVLSGFLNILYLKVSRIVINVECRVLFKRIC